MNETMHEHETMHEQEPDGQDRHFFVVDVTGFVCDCGERRNRYGLVIEEAS